MNPQGIIDQWWVEFLRHIKDNNELLKEINGTKRDLKAFEIDATEINFWRWYMEYKLHD